MIIPSIRIGGNNNAGYTWGGTKNEKRKMKNAGYTLGKGVYPALSFIRFAPGGRPGYHPSGL